MNADTAVHSVRSWLGIPYATAERFRRPALLPFAPERSYDQKGPAPLQAGDTRWLEADNGLSEDCLNLNIWAPEDVCEEPLPVIVYIFGGGFEMGANTQTTSNLSGLAATGRAIGVSLNYRLGPFGWLSLSQYGGVFADATNLGLQDIIAALQWVRENITHFGGDPQNVTVTGHSAGAYATIGLLAAPSADGLYRRLAAFSGGASRIVPAWWAEELAIKVLTELGIADDPERLLTVDGKLLAETLIKVSPRDIGDRHGIDNTTIGIVDDRWQTGAVLIDTPLHILASGRRRDVNILLSTATQEADWWVINAREKFDPGSIDKLVDELVVKSRIPRSRARRVAATYDVNGRAPVEVRGALFTDYFFTLPAARAALAHAAAGGSAHLLTVGPVEGAPAVHGTEMYGIVGQQRPGGSDEQASRDTFVRDALLHFAAGDHDRLWKAVTTQSLSHGIGNPPYDPTTHAEEVLQTFAGIERT
ncbi:carboxylesterase family protein [Ralstonia solanacearum]|uniref:carboxylesterase family protein n=1 Tax=Ralstonia solanacearum TaxID=305 RepID=UPI0007C9463D|nr:carboxylesterase/lipase family protein [Ralstonia solanacearum]MCL9824956.1 carboxylesterase/lipase family protein [Ralstonia solanacearum]MCL9828482.1 carboxylesterase/lipase family protein [Ralstonia solanacearum]MCL9833263.1 carboxylesterase/lipase family protein [Ralstonia solanacearum]OAI72224.1 carboxylesterase [Ralstonia solanacearum]